MKKVFIATPAYGGNCSILYMRNMIDLVIALSQNGYDSMFYDLSNESLINRARNNLTKKFLDTDSDYLLFIDADQGFNAAGILRMLKEDVDVIGATVPLKEINWKSVKEAILSGQKNIQDFTSVYNVNATEEQVKDLQPNTMFEVNNVGTGLMLIKRHVFEKMIPTTESYFGDQSLNRGEKIYNFWNIGIFNDRLYSEDFYFCAKWKELGGKVYAAPYVGVTHMGTYPFR